MNQSNAMVGCLIMDGDKLGLITNEIKSGTWTEEPLFNWTTSYEIKYVDGQHCIMTSGSFERLLEKGKIIILSFPPTGVLPPYYPTGGPFDES
tara:strand:+ start:1186 stop:1464 length:279 start_codon:yes stop_codon:yes gene_type:complete